MHCCVVANLVSVFCPQKLNPVKVIDQTQLSDVTYNVVLLILLQRKVPVEVARARILFSVLLLLCSTLVYHRRQIDLYLLFWVGLQCKLGPSSLNLSHSPFCGDSPLFEICTEDGCRDANLDLRGRFAITARVVVVVTRVPNA